MKTLRSAKRLMAGAVTALAACVALPGQAQTGDEPYPNKPIRLFMGQSPGGAPDILARILADHVGRRLGASVVIEYKPSAGGIIAQNALLSMPADGHALLMGTPSILAVTPYINKKLPFDPFKDFKPVTIVGESANILVAGPSVKAGSVAELIEYAKSHPGELKFASAGLGTPAHLAGELLAAQTGVKLLHVPYKGAGQALNDLVGGTVDFMITSPASSKPFLAGGHLKALATTGREPDPLLPELPLMRATVPGYEITQWWGFVVRSGTPDDIVGKIQQAVAQTLEDPKVIQQFKDQGVTPRSLTPEGFSKFLDEERRRYQDLIKRANIAVDN